MPEGKQALLERYSSLRQAMIAAIGGLTDAQMSEPSIDGWSVKDHLLHIALWDDLRATEVARISAGFNSAWKMSDSEDESYNNMAHDLRGNLSLAQAKWEFEQSHQRLMEAIAAATPRGLDPSTYGEAGLVTQHDEEHAVWIRRWRDERGY